MGRRDRAGSSRGRGPAASQPVTAASALAEAETFQQQAERRDGQAAVTAFRQAEEKFRQAIDLGLPPEQCMEAFFGLGESLQMHADTLVQLAAKSPGASESAAGEEQAAAAARQLYQQAVQAYRQVGSGRPDGALRVDAAINCGNALSSWAEASSSEDAVQLLTEAVRCYEMGLAQEDDSLTWGNLADALVQLAEAARRAGRPVGEAEAAAGRALAAYAGACALSDSGAGDDLPGLLHNWGAGLYTLAMCAQDPSAKACMLREAATRLRHSMQFERADPAPCIVLGDVLAELAELAEQPELRAELLQQSINEGYQAALNVHRYAFGALVGMADAKVTCARVAPCPAALLQESAALYRLALSRIEAAGGYAERNEVRYNAACVLTLVGEHEAARQLLERLSRNGALDSAHAAADADLASLRQHAWFQQLTGTPPAQ